MYIFTRNKGLLSFNRPDLYTYRLDEIGKCLQMLCRFSGHREISVLTHTRNMYEDALAHGELPIVLLAIMLHDAPEAYTGDITSPVQEYLGAEAKTRLAILHADMLTCICRDIGAPVNKVMDDDVARAVKYYDTRALWNEALQHSYGTPVTDHWFVTTVENLLDKVNDVG